MSKRECLIRNMIASVSLVRKPSAALSAIVARLKADLKTAPQRRQKAIAA